MAKASESNGNNKPTNKSAAIRNMIAEYPTATSKEIISLLADKGIKVAPTLVYYIRSKQKQEKRKEKRERVAETSRSTAVNNPVELVVKVKALAREVGGIRHLKKLVDLLAE